jgi:CRP/FNR family transcriptional regulator, cAMP and macrophage regulator
MGTVESRDPPAGALGPLLRRFGGTPADASVRQAAWIARCVGRGEGAPLRPGDLASLADVLQTRTVARDTVMFAGGQRQVGVWIVRAGRVELSVGSGRRRVVVHLLQPGDVDGDIQLLLEMPMPYTARALAETTCLYLADADFDALLRRSPTLARRWMSSIAMRLATSQNRILGLLGKSLTEQVAQLLLDEADNGTVALTQRTLAAMLGVQRPSLNKILKELESDDLITVGYGTIKINDGPALAKRAAAPPR